MEENNLDDFFAKKDKSKKSKASKITPDDILTKADELYKKSKRKGKEKPKMAKDTSYKSNAVGLIVNSQEADDWKEVVEEEEKDYSGLRIANLQVSEKKEESTGEEEVKKDDEDEGSEQEDTSGKGPWKNPTTTATTLALAATAEAPKVEEPKPMQKYISPGQRAAAATAATSGQSLAGPTLPSHLRKKKAAPNIQSEFDFPSLGGAYQPSHADGDHHSFEKVQHCRRQMNDPSKSSEKKLSLGNKFTVLQD